MAKYLILKYGPEYTGRKMSVNKISLNIFTAKLNMTDFKIYENDGTNLFFSVDRFMIDLSWFKLIQSKIKVDALEIDNPKISIYKTDSKYNFSDILETLKNKSQKKKKKKESSLFSLENLELKNMNFTYSDSTMEDKFKINIDTFAIPKFESAGKIKLSYYLLSKSNLEIKSTLELDETTAKIDFEKLYLNFHLLNPFLKKYLYISKLDGTLLTSNKIVFDLENKALTFSGKTDINNIKLTDSEKRDIFSLKSLSADVRDISTKDNRYYINSIKVTDPKIIYEMFKGGSNFTKLLKILPEKKKNETKLRLPDDYLLNEFSISGLDVSFSDMTIEKRFDYRIFNTVVSTSAISSVNEKLEFDVSSNMNYDTAQVDAKVILENKNLDSFSFKFKSNNLKLDDFSHYASKYANISSVKGNYSAILNLKANITNSSIKVSANGSSTISNFSIIDKVKSVEIVKCKTLSFELENLSIPENNVVLKNVEIDKLGLHLFNSKEGNILELLMPGKFPKIAAVSTSNSISTSNSLSGTSSILDESSKIASTTTKAIKPDIKTESTKKPSINYTLLIRKLNFKNGTLKISDNTLEKPFSYEVDVPEVSGKNLTNKGEAPGTFKVRIVTNKKGRINLDGEIMLGTQFSIKTNYSIDNLVLKDIKPLTEKYSPIVINEGILNYTGSLSIKNNKLSNNNNVILKKIDLKEKKILFIIPLNLIISIVESGDGEVTLDVPVEGDLKSPKFNYWNTIIIALKNIFMKIVSAPFAFLNFGGNDNAALERLDFNLLDKQFSKKEDEKLDKLAEIMIKKPRINFEFTQYTDTEKEYHQMLLNILRNDYYKSTTKKEELLKEDLEQISQISELDKNLLEYINANIPEDKNELDFYGKCEIIYGKELMKKQYNDILEGRNKYIRDKITQKGVLESRIKVQNADFENLDAQDKLQHYKVKMASE